MIRPSLSGLRVFEAAARLLSFKDAAGELGLTPTAVSHQIRALEAQLDTALFDRHHRAVTLTEAGRTLSQAATSAVDLLDTAIERIRDGETRLTVSATPAFAALWLAPRLAEIAAACPGLTLRLEGTVEPVDLARQRHVDAAIRYGPMADSDPTILVRERFQGFANAALAERIAHGEPAPLFVPTWQNRRLPDIDARAWASAAGLATLLHPVSVDEEQHAVMAALGGQGVAFVSDILASHLAAQGLLTPLDPGAAIPGFCYRLLMRHETRERKSVRLFQRWLAAAFAANRSG